MYNEKKLTRSLVVLMVVGMLLQSFVVFSSAGTFDEWINTSGRTVRVYSTVSSCKAQGGDYIGSLYAGDFAYYFGLYSGCYVVVYSIDNPAYERNDYKVGFVNYSGGIVDTFVGEHYYKNGSTNEPVYKTTYHAANQINSIGSLDKWETCDYLGKMNGFTIVVYNASNTKKVGFVRYDGFI